MKSKRAVYFLLLAVVVIWSFVAYRIYLTFNKEIVLATTDEISFPEKNNVNSEFEIIANYRDPFLGKLGSEISKPIEKKKIDKPILMSPGISQWPEIKFRGIIKNQQSSKQLALININGKARIIQVDQSIDEITLNKIYRDSIVVVFKKEKRSFKK